MSSHVGVEQQVGVVVAHDLVKPTPCAALRLTEMSNLDRRGGYTPRRAREQRAYRMVVAGGAAGASGSVTLVLAIAGVISATLPLLAFIVAAICVFGFLRTTGQR